MSFPYLDHSSEENKLSPESSGEQRIWSRFLAGEESAFTALMTTYYRPLFRYATRFSRDKEFIKDSIQDLFLYLWERRSSLRADAAVKPYLMASLRRSMYRNLPDSQQFSDADEGRGSFDFEFSVEEQFIHHETSFQRARHIKHLLETLPRRQKEVVYLKYFQEMEREQIAQVMDIAPQTVSNLLQLALRQLRQYWKIELLTLIIAHLALGLSGLY